MHFQMIMVNYVVRTRRNTEFIEDILKVSQNTQFCKTNFIKQGAEYSDMPASTICKTVHQYNSKPIPEADMRKLQEIAKDYNTVKNYVYQRDGGI